MTGVSTGSGSVVGVGSGMGGVRGSVLDNGSFRIEVSTAMTATDSDGIGETLGVCSWWSSYIPPQRVAVLSQTVFGSET